MSRVLVSAVNRTQKLLRASTTLFFRRRRIHSNSINGFPGIQAWLACSRPAPRRSLGGQQSCKRVAGSHEDALGRCSNSRAGLRMSPLLHANDTPPTPSHPKPRLHRELFLSVVTVIWELF